MPDEHAWNKNRLALHYRHYPGNVRHNLVIHSEVCGREGKEPPYKEDRVYIYMRRTRISSYSRSSIEHETVILL